MRRKIDVRTASSTPLPPAFQQLNQFCSLDLHLLAGGEGFDGCGRRGDLVFAEDDDVTRGAVGSLEGFLEAEGSVADFNGEASAAEFTGEGQRRGVAFDAHGGD